MSTIWTYRAGEVGGDGGGDERKSASQGLRRRPRPVVCHPRDRNWMVFRPGFEPFGHRVVARSTLLA